MNLINRAAIAVQTKMNEFTKAVTTKKDGGIGVIVTVVLLVIAIALLASFRGEIVAWLGNINTEINSGITDNFKPN